VFDTKNITPRQIALFNALTIALIGSIANLIFFTNWWVPIITFATLFVIAYC
jgi:CHASE2 domain-containing sensor protein